MKTRKATPRPYKRIVISGEPSSGKTTGAVNYCDNALWIDLDNRIPNELTNKCTVIEGLRKFSDINLVLKEILKMDKLDHKAIVVDTISLLEAMARDYSIEQDYGDNKTKYCAYSQGDKQNLPVHIGATLTRLDAIAEKHGCDIILICHSEIKKVRNTNGEDYDKQILQLVEKVRNRILQWGDYIGFVWKKVEVEKSGMSSKATGGNKMVISFSNDPRFDAKGPAGLPDEIEFDIEGKWVNLIKGVSK